MKLKENLNVVVTKMTVFVTDLTEGVTDPTGMQVIIPA